MDRKFVNQWNFDPTIFVGYDSEDPSETIPNQALSISEVLKRFTNGTLGDIIQNVSYDDDPDFDDYDPTFMSDFDLSDADAIQERIDYLQSLLNQEEIAETPVAVETAPVSDSNPTNGGV